MPEREFILGGQKSGKSRRAEQRAADWLARAPTHRAVLIATALPHDAEMRERIERHRRDRAARVPGLRTVEEPVGLARALAAHNAPGTLVVVDCLTLWLAQLLMPIEDAGSAQAVAHGDADDAPPRTPAIRQPEEHGSNRGLAPVLPSQVATFLIALESASGPVVVVGNEIGLGVIPLGREVRAFVDALGALNQRVAAACERVTLMAAGLPLALKEPT